MSNNLIRGLLVAVVVAPLTGCQGVLLSPAGDLALRQRDLIIISTLLMLIIIVPVIVLTLLFAWHYRASNTKAVYDPEWDHSTRLELLIWAAPLLIIIALGALTWVSTHKLDPFRPLDRLAAGRPVPADARPLVIDVVALDWKWLFIYPEQGIATVNEAAAPVDRPIRFHITASSVMNSFFIPAVAGQIYAMPGMETKLQAVVNQPGEFEGFSANFSGDGFNGMHFVFRGVSNEGFTQWVQQAKSGNQALGRDAYLKLAQPSENEPVSRYATVASGLFDDILTHCVQSNPYCMGRMQATEAGQSVAADACTAPAPQYRQTSRSANGADHVHPI